MVLVDTSIWIEWLIGSPTGRLISPDLPETRSWVVPTIVQLELAKWLIRNVDEARADKVLAFADTCKVVTLDTVIARSAAELSVRRGLATADAIVYATARAHDALLLTCDRHFEGLDAVRFIEKRQG